MSDISQVDVSSMPQPEAVVPPASAEQPAPAPEPAPTAVSHDGMVHSQDAPAADANERQVPASEPAAAEAGPEPPPERQICTWERVDKKATRFVFTKSRNSQKSQAVLALTVQNLDTLEYYEDKLVVLGLKIAELTKPLPLQAPHKTCQLRTVLYYDPDFDKPSGYWHMGHCIRYYKDSNNPGLPSTFWSGLGKKQQDSLITQFKVEIMCIFANPPPKPRVELLRPIGVPVPDTSARTPLDPVPHLPPFRMI